MTALHRLVTKQLVKATRPSGEVDHVLLCELMSTCYEEMERDRKRVDRANKLMQEELTQMTGDLERLIEQLRVQNLHFQAALDNMSQGLCLLDAEGRLAVANQRFLQIYGLAADAGRPGRPMAEILGESAMLQSPHDYLALTSAGRAGTLHQELKNGHCILIAHEPLARGGCVDTFEDITERKRAEARLVLATEVGNIGLWEGHLRGGTAWFSDQYWSMLGYRPGELPPTFETARDLTYPDDRPRLVEALRALRAGKSADLNLEFRMHSKNGSLCWIHCKGRVVERAPDGKGLRISGVHIDVTDRREAEARLAAAERLESIGQLAAGVAHEINTPVQYVNDSVYFIREGMGELLAYIDKLHAALPAAGPIGADILELQQELPAALERVAEGLARVAEIVGSMKEFSHPDQDTMGPVDLNRGIHSTLVVARNEFKYVAELETDFSELPPVTCHGSQINQVVLNLVVNAAHAIADVVKGTSEKGRITVKTLMDGNEAVICVSDTGGGIPEAIRHRIFEPFFTTKEVGRGTGQGLSIARNVVVQGHGGSISCQTEVGKGTTFFVRLPIDGKSNQTQGAAA